MMVVFDLHTHVLMFLIRGLGYHDFLEIFMIVLSLLDLFTMHHPARLHLRGYLSTSLFISS